MGAEGFTPGDCAPNCAPYWPLLCLTIGRYGGPNENFVLVRTESGSEL